MSSLVVNTNLSAIDAYNNLNSTDNAMTQAISELSSGLQIQTAADNPAGYVVSQALESQSNGYQQAIQNAQNGVSLIQTASGALNQISSILQTMDQLALNSANGATNDSNSFNANQQEFVALQNQIQQIAQTTSFGSTNLLDGSFSNQVLQVGAFAAGDQQINLTLNAADVNALGVATTTQGATLTGTGGATPSATTGLVTVNITVDGTAAQAVLNLASVTTAAGVEASINAAFSSIVNVTLNANNQLVFSTTTTGSNQTITLGGVSINEIGLASGTASGTTAVGVSSQSNAEQAVSAVQQAINTVASMEANVGAIQNQLQAVVANLTVGQQNLTAAYSGLVDVNFAQETTTFTTDQILMQSGVAMLSQAQQTPSLVLKLLS